MARSAESHAPLILEWECKLASLVDPRTDGSVRLEASGIVAGDRSFIVVFDNLSAVARLRGKLRCARATWIDTSIVAEGFEDIAYDARRRRYYLLVESEALRDGQYASIIHEVDGRFEVLRRARIAVPFEKPNKGFEGLAWTNRRGRGYLLATPEAGKAGARRRRKPYRCRIYVLRESRSIWRPVAKFKLPRAARFKDYAGLAVRSNRVAVASQESSALWVGRLHPRRWEVIDDGQVFDFPRDEHGRILYGNVEGLEWLSSSRIVVVSDRASRGGQPARCQEKDQSIHIFRIPSI